MFPESDTVTNIIQSLKALKGILSKGGNLTNDDERLIETAKTEVGVLKEKISLATRVIQNLARDIALQQKSRLLNPKEGEIQEKIVQANQKFHILGSLKGNQLIDGMRNLILDSNDRTFIHSFAAIQVEIEAKQQEIEGNLDRGKVGDLHFELCLLREKEQSMLTKEKSRLLKCVRDLKKDEKKGLADLEKVEQMLNLGIDSISDRKAKLTETQKNKDELEVLLTGIKDKEKIDGELNSLNGSFNSNSYSRGTSTPISNDDSSFVTFPNIKSGKGDLNFTPLSYPSAFNPTSSTGNEGSKNGRPPKQEQQYVKKGAEAMSVDYNTHMTVPDLLSTKTSSSPIQNDSSDEEGSSASSTSKQKGNSNIFTLRTQGGNGGTGRKMVSKENNSSIRDSEELNSDSEELEDLTNSSFASVMAPFRENKILDSPSNENKELDSLPPENTDDSLNDSEQTQMAPHQIETKKFLMHVSHSSPNENTRFFPEALSEKHTSSTDAANKLSKALSNTISKQNPPAREFKHNRPSLRGTHDSHRNSGPLPVNYDITGNRKPLVYNAPDARKPFVNKGLNSNDKENPSRKPPEINLQGSPTPGNSTQKTLLTPYNLWVQKKNENNILRVTKSSGKGPENRKPIIQSNYMDLELDGVNGRGSRMNPSDDPHNPNRNIKVTEVGGAGSKQNKIESSPYFNK